MKLVWRSTLPGYGIAGVSTALATLAQFPLRPLVGSQHPYSFFYVAVLVTAWYAGLRRALLALILGALSANYFFLPPENSLAIAGAANQIGLALYLLVALVGALLIEALRQQRPVIERLQPQAAFPATEQAARAAAQEAQRRLTEAQQGARALADQLKTVREALAKANETVGCQRDELEQLTEVIDRSPGREARPVAEAPLSRLPIQGSHSVLLLRVAEIDYAECRNREVFVWSSKGEYPASYTLADLEALLPAECFCRVNDAYLVNLDRIMDLVFLENDRHEIHLSDGQRLPVGPSRYPELRRRLGLDDYPHP